MVARVISASFLGGTPADAGDDHLVFAERPWAWRALAAMLRSVRERLIATDGIEAEANTLSGMLDALPAKRARWPTSTCASDRLGASYTKDNDVTGILGP